MTKIRDSHREKLLRKLVDDLPSIAVEDGCFLNYKEIYARDFGWDNILKGTDTLSSLKEMIDDEPVRDFVFDFIRPRLFKAGIYNSDVPDTTLGELPQFSDMNALAAEIVSAIEALPARYECLLGLDSGLREILPEGENHIAVGKFACLRRVDAEFLAEYPHAGHTGNALAAVSSKTYPEGSLVLQISVAGYIDAFTSTQTSARVVSLVKSFFGLGLALGLFKPLGRGFHHTVSDRKSIKCFRTISGVKDHVHIGSSEFDPDSVDRITNLAMAEAIQTFADTRRSAIIRIVGNIGTCLDDPSNKLQRASRYYFDSISTRDELQSYVQAMIAFEVLLGDRGVGKTREQTPTLMATLSNRCAYMIAESRNEREEIMSEFAVMYDIRSSIVHRGKMNLSSNERRLLYRLRYLLSRVIQRESMLTSRNAVLGPLLSGAT